MKIKNPVKCQYCDQEAKLVKGVTIYPRRRDLYTKHFYHCEPCDAYVGCHAGTLKPLGVLANKELRAWKSAAHKFFDPLWRSGKMKRNDAYQWLAQELSIEPDECHIGMFSVDKCKATVDICIERGL